MEKIWLFTLLIWHFKPRFFEGYPGSRFVLEKIWLFTLLIWHFKASGICFKFHANREAVVVLLVLEATLVLLTAQVPVWCNSSKVHRLFFQAVLVIWPTSARISTADKVSLSFVPFEPRSLQQRRMHKNYNFGTSINNIVECLWIEIVQCKKVKLRSCR